MRFVRSCGARVTRLEPHTRFCPHTAAPGSVSRGSVSDARSVPCLGSRTHGSAALVPHPESRALVPTWPAVARPIVTAGGDCRERR